VKRVLLILSLLAVISILFSAAPVLAQESIPVEIHNITELQNIKANLNADYVLVNDIDSSEINFIPISGFSGTLDGNGHTISNLSSTGGKYSEAGLFSYTRGATIKNLKVVDSNFKGTVAGLVAYAGNSVFLNCSIQGIITGIYFTGGIAGILDKGSITNCSSLCTLSGTYDVGGIAGFIDSATVSHCTFSGEISSGNNTGGAVGYLSKGTVEKCSITGNIAGSSRLGSIAGYNGGSITNSYFIGEIAPASELCIAGGLTGSNYGYIDKCYTVPTFSGYGTIGGLIGFNNNSITDSYFGTDNSTRISLVGDGNKHTDLFVTPSKSVEIESGNGTTTGCDFLLPNVLKVKSTFENWDFANIWTISSDINDGYPTLLP
jgi:hypothetical protein